MSTVTPDGTSTLPRLKQRYNDTVRDQLKDDGTKVRSCKKCGKDIA